MRHLVALLSVLTVASVGAPAEAVAEGPADETERAGEMVRGQAEIAAGPGNAEVVFDAGFGRWEILREFGPTAWAPGDGQAVTFDVATGRIALLDVRNGEYDLGVDLPGPATAMEVTDDGRWAYVSWRLPTSGQFRTIDGIERVDLDDISTSTAVELPEPNGEDRRGVFSVLPGETDTVLVTLGDRIGLVKSGALLPSVLTDARFVNDGVVATAEIAYLSLDDEIHELTMDATGITGLTNLGVPLDDRSLARNGDVVLLGRDVLDIGASAPRPATDFERALVDPVLPLRFLDYSGDPFSNGSTTDILDNATGDVLTQTRGGCFDSYQSTLIGDGYIVSGGASMTVVNVPDACGSYGEFTPVDPSRVLDTRNGQGLDGGPRQIAGGETLRVKIHGLGGVPLDGVESVVLNVTALRQSGAGDAGNYVTVWPAGFDQPTVSNLNIRDGEIVGNMVTVSTAAGGYVDVYSDRGSVGLTVDVMGYFASAVAPGGARFLNVRNERLVDTRTSGGALSDLGSLTMELPEVGLDRLASNVGVVAAVVNVTALQPTQLSHFRIFPTGSPLPDASSMNFEARRNTNRLVTVKVVDGRFDIWNASGDVGLTVDLVGVYVAESAEDELDTGRFIGLVPFREFDSRISSPFEGNGSIPDFSLVSLGGWLRSIDLVANVTAIRPTETGFVSTGPWNEQFEPFLETSSLNFGPGDIVANQTISAIGSNGEIGIFNGPGSTHVALDIFGYYTGA